jgi:hypothetical protein
LYNNEAVPLSFTVTLSNPDYTETDTCQGSVAAKSYCTMTVTLTPSALGPDNGTLSVTDTASNSPQTATLTGTGIVQATVAPTSLTFAAQSVETTGGASNVTLTNNLSTALMISTITFTGANPSDFAASTNACGASLAAKSHCTIPVTFTPGAPGTRSATLNVNDGANNSPQTVSLSGTGMGPVDGLAPTSLAFNNQAVGTPSTAQTATLSNTGNAALSITSLAFTGTNPGDFAQTNTCGSSVAAGAKCTISVTFTPLASGSRTASVTITDNASGSPQTVSLSGTGMGPVDGLAPTSLAFGNQSVGTPSTAQTATLSNTGNAALSITSLALTGTNPGDFAQTNTCGSSVAAGANCTISVTFTPLASGSRTASVTITDNASDSPQTVSLSGTGSNPQPSLTSLSPASAVVGAAAQTLTINGTNFVSSSTVTYNGVAHTPTLVSSTQLTISLSTTDQATAGTYAVVVTNPGPGGGASNSVSFTVSNLVPTITSLSPTSATVGAAAQTLTINGTNFVSSSTVTYNGVAHTPTLVSSTQLTISLSAADQATAGSYAVVVTNPAPGGGASSPLTFAVGNPAPTLTSLSPTSAVVGAASQTLTLTGTNFLASSTVTYNGVAHTPTLVSSTQLTISLSAADQATAGSYAVVVTNPAPGGGASSPLTFAVGNPAPTLTSLSPTSAVVGAASQTLTLTGTNFLASSTVTYNGVGHTATFVSSTQLTISLSATDQATAGSYAVVVTNPAPGGGASSPLNFTVTSPIVSLSPTSLAFVNQPVDMTSSAQTVTLSNTGNATLSITSLALTGTNASDFGQSNTCGSSLAAGANCTIAVMFTPSASGTEAASLSITDNASGSPQTVSLSGTGMHDVILSWTDSTTTGVVGYNVYRGTTSGGESATPLNSSPINGPTYTDATVQAGQTYYYVVTAVASNDVTQSADSKEVSATVP